MKKIFGLFLDWYRRRFRGIVAVPGGTTWQQHKSGDIGFTCRCGRVMAFSLYDLKIRERNHDEDCARQFSEDQLACTCPIADARYIHICPSCRMGHWKEWKGVTLNG